MTDREHYLRTGGLLKRKFAAYLVPTMLTSAALSLNEFVDSMAVSRLLDPESMAVVNLGMPVMQVMACVYVLLGNGGATLFAAALGERKREEAGTCFRTAMLAAAAAGLLMTVLGLVFFRPAVNLLCPSGQLSPAFGGYLRVLLLSAAPIIVILSFTEFLPPCGVPAFATAINIVANGVNLVMDYVYIRWFHMGVEGAAYATLTGYAVGLLPIAWLVLSGRLKIPAGKWFGGKTMKRIAVTGSSSAGVQLGYALKFGYSNVLAISLGGTAGMVAFSLCIQAISVASVFLAGAVSAAVPLMAVLHGQKDYYGETTVLKSALRVTVVTMAVSAVLFALFPGQVASIYGVAGAEQADLVSRALRIFVASFVIRGVCIVMMRYLQVIGANGFALFISLFDGCAGIIPISWLCTRLMGLDGVWAAYTVTAVILLAIVAFRNLRTAKKSGGQLKGVLLTRQEESPRDTVSWTIPEEKPAWLSETLSAFCRESGLSERTAIHTGLVAEEMVLYTREQAKRSDYMDIIARRYPDRVEIDFRSLGNPVNPLAAPAESADPLSPDARTVNLTLLRKMADKLGYEYVMGMNCTHAEIGVGEKE